MPLINHHLLNIYCVLGTVVGTEERKVNKTVLVLKQIEIGSGVS